MNGYDQTIDPEVLIGHCDLISWFNDFCLISRHSIGMRTHFFHNMFGYDKTFDAKVFLGHCNLISWFIDFALYCDTQLVGWSGENMSTPPLGPRRKRWAACASMQSF